jgi:hypothetical protein
MTGSVAGNTSSSQLQGMPAGRGQSISGAPKSVKSENNKITFSKDFKIQFENEKQIPIDPDRNFNR